jgi:hypothetical protein
MGEGRKSTLEPKFTVHQIGNIWYAERDDGVLQFPSVYGEVTIQAAINALTVGRNYKEKVSVKGYVPLNQQGVLGYCLNLPNYTILDLEQARIFLNNAQNCNMINIGDGGVNPVTETDLLLGVSWGNRAQNAVGHIVQLNHAKRCSVKSGIGWYAPEDGIHLTGTAARTNNVTVIDDIRMYLSGRYGYYEEYTYETAAYMLYVQESVNRNLYLNGAAGHFFYCHSVLGGNIGIHVLGHDYWFHTCESEHNQQDGYLLDGDDNRLLDNLIWDNGLRGVGTDAGVKVATGQVGNQIKGCKILDNETPPTQDYGIEETDVANRTLIENNELSNHLVANMLPIGNLTRIYQNVGYNPQGNLANPYPAAAGYLLDTAGAQAFPTTHTTYTVGQSRKLITIYGGTVSQILIDGVVCGLTSGAFCLDVGQTIHVDWTGQPSSAVYRM